jgi:hypothetical protein
MFIIADMAEIDFGIVDKVAKSFVLKRYPSEECKTVYGCGL